MADEQAVLVDKWHDVRDRGDCDEIEEFFEIQRGGTSFHEGVSDLENHPGGAEVGKIFPAFRVYQRRAIRSSFGIRLMMVDDDHIDSHFPQVGDLFDGDGAAID